MTSPHRLRVAIITENFLPELDGITVTLIHLLAYLNAQGVETLLLGPQSGMKTYAGCALVGASGFPLRAYPGLKINFIPMSFFDTLCGFSPDVIHLVDPIWLGIQALTAFKILLPGIPLVTSHDTNLPTYSTIYGFPYFRRRAWRVLRRVHSIAECTFVPSHSTATLLSEKGYANLRVCDRGVDVDSFNVPGALKPRHPEKLGLTSRRRRSPVRGATEPGEESLASGRKLLPPSSRSQRFVGDGPLKAPLRRLCTTKNIRAVFLGALTGRALGEAFASADIMSAPSFTETFGQVTLEALASGLPVVGLYAEGTVDLITHLKNGLLLDVHASDEVETNDLWQPCSPLPPGTKIACYDTCAELMRPSSDSFAFLATQYAALLEQLISNPTLRDNMAVAALSTAQEYPWNRCTQKILDVYLKSSCTASNRGFVRFAQDVLMVGVAVLVAALSHLLFMVPTIADLLRR
ncbi:hypothetical protein B0H16DRAFT_1715915 [Mycena metata]|uniref:Glycosyltransferase subfamily 4-like N-terminal domain-containing protein n=1 Tax=Mycena metata TaxID=1033252 RepID=A0AAD7JTY1_9AGAR|nr:hypothetical protein B0H16DRAFT_1715915 [Mycena metata]